jgi:hypothetical protein
MMGRRPYHIEIVTHCYSGPGSGGQYTQHLKWQFASLVHYSAPVKVCLSVCYTTEGDRYTAQRLARMERMLSEMDGLEHLHLKLIRLTPGQLFRRAIGRNYAALHSTARVVWFTDVDYLFGPKCLQTLAKLASNETGLIYPERLLISKDHATGAAAVKREERNQLPKIKKREFAERRQRLCIGGVQIVGGDLARAEGYCQGTKWVEPVDPAAGFRSCACDKAYRRGRGAEHRPIPSVYRLRHELDGRDYNLEGEKVGREVW